MKNFHTPKDSENLQVRNRRKYCGRVYIVASTSLKQIQVSGTLDKGHSRPEKYHGIRCACLRLQQLHPDPTHRIG
jgi:hypothetical protein